jgi:hypothetical protein
MAIRALAAIFALAAVASLAVTQSAIADPTPAAAIAELNQWRSQLGESTVSTTDVAVWDTGCQHHNNYEHVNNNALTHPENSLAPGYTADGATAGPDSVLAEEVSAPNPAPDSHLLPGPAWDSAVFHRAAVLQPRLANVGFNSSTFLSAGTYTSFACLWDQNDPAETTPYVPPYAIDNRARPWASRSTRPPQTAPSASRPRSRRAPRSLTPGRSQASTVRPSAG